MTILLTGVTGFAGRSVAAYFLDRGYRVIGASRRAPDDHRIEFRPVSSIDRYTCWSDALKDVDVIVHLAGRAHQMRESVDSHHFYFETNLDGTLNFATQAAEAGIKKFIFISTIKAMLSDAHEEALTEAFPCNPIEPYGMSKLKAEIELHKISQKYGMALVILRPPLMYGPGVKGNMASLIRLVRRLPLLPLGGLTNRRSLLGVKNFASAIEAVMNTEVANGKTYLLSDGEEISTSELVKRLTEVFNPACKIMSLPPLFWKIGAKIPGLAPKLARLSGSLPIDSSLITKETGWNAPFLMQEQLKEML